MRPVYETDETKAREDAVVELLCRHLDKASGLTERSWLWRRLPISYRLDYAIEDSREVKAWCEVKCRDIRRTQYETLILAVGKWVAGTELAGATGLPFVVLVMWRDAVGFFKWDRVFEPKISWGGRTRKTRDSADIEPVVHLPVDEFIEVKV